jgi:hypothetical protein
VLVVTLAFGFRVLPADHRAGAHHRLDLVGALLPGLGILALTGSGGSAGAADTRW